jgi:bzd-type benzoyl-CoA reductase N subunit
MTTEKRGIARAKQVYRDRSCRARELRSQGKTVAGYICLYPVVEMLTAAGVVPYRMFGDMKEPITLADTHMAAVVCPFMRSVLDIGMKGRYDFLDGVVFAHVCDVACMIPGMWRQAVPTPYSFFLDVPHTTRPAALEYFRGNINDYRKSLEDFTGAKITPARLRQAVAAHNEQRAMVRELYELKKPDPPLVSGSETLQVLKSVMSLPVEEGNALLREVIDEVKSRPNRLTRKGARLIVWGSIIDDTAMIDMVESLDANVVMDDTCVGSRAFFTDVPVTEDPLDGLAQHYLVDIRCPRTFREATPGAGKKDYRGDLEARFGYLRHYAREWNVNGAILQSVRYCDGHGYEVPGVKDYFADMGIPTVYLEHNYSVSALAPLRTRVQGLTEIIG